MAMQNLGLSRDLRELLKCFISHNVKYLVIGGHAVSFHGYPRFTKDLDVWIESSVENANAVTAALIDYGFHPDSVRPEMFNNPERMTKMGREPNHVDILQTILGVVFRECFARCQFADIDGTRIPIISRDDLLANKLATARPQDIADAHQLNKLITAEAKKNKL
jgi:predicted nucleotidyltransferase